MWLQGKPVNGMAGCHCERSRSDPRSNLGIKTKIATPPAGARNDRRAGTSPAPTRQPRRSVPTAIPVFCRGEAELSKTRSQGFCLAPTPRRAARCAAPARRPKSPPCHCEAQPKQSGGIKKEIATPPAGARNDRRAGTSPAPTSRPTPRVIARRNRSNLAIFKTGIATPPAGARNDKRAGTSPAPTHRPRRSVPTAIPPCHCEAQPKQFGDFQNRDCHAPCGGSQ